MSGPQARVDPRVVEHLQACGVSCCVIGGVAIAAHGVPRYTVDLDLLVADRRVLVPAFWPAAFRPTEVLLGEFGHTVAGTLRWQEPASLDVVVIPGAVGRHAVEHASRVEALGLPVASALSLVLLKLEAGSQLDARDVIMLVEAGRASGAPWIGEIEALVPMLSPDARRLFDRMRTELGLGGSIES